MSSFDKEVGSRLQSTIWRRRRRGKRMRAAGDEDFHPLVRETVTSARDYLLAQQHPETGGWCGEVPADPYVTAEYLLLLVWLRQGESKIVDSLRSFLLRCVNLEGAWSAKSGDVDVSTSTLCYLALKLSGSAADDLVMQQACEAIRGRGGADVVNGLTRFYLSLFGQDSYDRCPVLPPEFLLLPRWLPLNLTRWSRWARAILVPLSILWALKPVIGQRSVEPDNSSSHATRADLENQASGKLATLAAIEIEELFLDPASRRASRYQPQLVDGSSLRGRWWQFNTRVASVMTRAIERSGFRPFRRKALRVAEHWLAERLDEQNGIVGSSTATVLSAIAFESLGHSVKSVPVQTCLAAINNMQTQAAFKDQEEDSADESNENVRRRLDTSHNAIGVSPCRVAIQDTAIATQALAVSGVDPHTNQLRRGLEWLLQSEASRPGDWTHVVRADPGGWSREFPSHHYPHITASARVLQSLREPFANNPPSSLVTDDSMVAMIRANSVDLARQQIAVLDRVAAASRRARLWLIAMQNADGGWPCADRHPAKAILYSPRFTKRFPIHDQSTAEATGFVLQALGSWEMGCGQSSIDRAVSYLRQLQLPDGSWSAVHSGSDVRATSNVILGLRAVGISSRDMTINAAVRWLLARQESTGCWGECPLETAWAMLALDQAGLIDSEHTGRAARFLVEHQQPSGSWLVDSESPQGGADLVECESELSNVAIPLLALAKWGLSNRVLN